LRVRRPLKSRIVRWVRSIALAQQRQDLDHAQCRSDDSWRCLTTCRYCQPGWGRFWSSDACVCRDRPIHRNDRLINTTPTIRDQWRWRIGMSALFQRFKHLLTGCLAIPRATRRRVSIMWRARIGRFRQSPDTLFCCPRMPRGCPVDRARSDTWPTTPLPALRRARRHLAARPGWCLLCAPSRGSG